MEKVVFQNALNQRLSGWLHRGPASGELGPTVVLCHGMMSSKEGTKQKAFAVGLGKLGLSVLRFDFSFCGESEGKFEEISFAQEVDDLRCAVEWVRGRGANPIGLLGSSMGAAVALLYAREAPFIGALVALAAVGDPGRLVDRMEDLKHHVERWKAEGYRFGAEGEAGEGFYEDARRQDVLGAARKILSPLLILHGEDDEVVPVEDARALFENAAGPKALNVLPACDHRFTRPEHLAEALRAAGDWFRRYLLA